MNICVHSQTTTSLVERVFVTISSSKVQCKLLEFTKSLFINTTKSLILENQINLCTLLD